MISVTIAARTVYRWQYPVRHRTWNIDVAEVRHSDQSHTKCIFCLDEQQWSGFRPQSTTANSTAAIGEPMPSANIGNNAEVPQACAAVSGAADTF